MGHRNKRQKEKRRRQRKHLPVESKAYHPPKLTRPWWYRCKFYIPGRCGECSDGQLHLVSPAKGLMMCAGWCCHRDMQVWCVKVKKAKRSEWKDLPRSKSNDEQVKTETRMGVADEEVGEVERECIPEEGEAGAA